MGMILIKEDSMRIALVVAVCLSALVITFALQNAQTVQVQFLGWYFEGPLVIALLITFGAGAASMYLMALPGRISARRKLSDLRRQLDDAHRETERLRAGKTESDKPRSPIPPLFAP